MSASDFIPYGRQSISQEDIDAVTSVLRSNWLTTGPVLPKFEAAISELTDCPYVVGVSSGTAALHAAMYAANIGPGDEVIVPSLTFAASANAAVYQGATPVFVDVRKNDLLIDPAEVAKKITSRTKAIVAVDYAGQACDYRALRSLIGDKKIVLIADACHAIGGSQDKKKVGTLADMSCFSFHPVKHITTAEGGAVGTANEEYSKRMKLFRNHGISSDHRSREENRTLHYEMIDLGFNYRLNDVQCALGLSQSKHLTSWVKRRNEVSTRYNKAFAGDGLIEPVETNPGNYNAHHLYVVKLNLEKMKLDRDAVFRKMFEKSIGVNCHYPPAHLHPFYRRRFGTKDGTLPVTEWAHPRILSLPMYSSVTDAQVDYVVESLKGIVHG